MNLILNRWEIVEPARTEKARSDGLIPFFYRDFRFNTSNLASEFLKVRNK